MKTTTKQILKTLIGGKKIRNGVNYTSYDLKYEEATFAYGHLVINFSIEQFGGVYEMKFSRLHNPTTNWVAPSQVEEKITKELFQIKEIVLEILHRRRVQSLQELRK